MNAAYLFSKFIVETEDEDLPVEVVAGESVKMEDIIRRMLPF